MPLAGDHSRIILYQRRIQDELAVHYALTLAIDHREMERLLPDQGKFPLIKEDLLSLLLGQEAQIIEVKQCIHPSLWQNPGRVDEGGRLFKN